MDFQQRMRNIDARIAARREFLERTGRSAATETAAARANPSDPAPSCAPDSTIPCTENDIGMASVSGRSGLLGDKCYRFLKYMVLIALPAIGSLYFGLSKIWDFPFGEEFVGTISLLCTFFGTLLGVSSHYYYKQ